MNPTFDALENLVGLIEESNARILLEHLALGGTLVEDGDDLALTRDAQQRFSRTLVHALNELDYVRKVDGTFMTPGHEKFWTITNAGRAFIGKKQLYGTVDLIDVLGNLPHQIDRLTWAGELPAVATAARKRIYDEQSLRFYRGEIGIDDLDAVTVFKISAAAKVAELSEVTVRKHVKLRLLYGYLIGASKGNNVMVFTSEQMANYLTWLKTRNWRDQVRLQS